MIVVCRASNSTRACWEAGWAEVLMTAAHHRKQAVTLFKMVLIIAILLLFVSPMPIIQEDSETILRRIYAAIAISRHKTSVASGRRLASLLGGYFQRGKTH